MAFKVKKELRDVLVGYGLTDDEIDDLAVRIDGSIQQFGEAKLQAERQLEHNEVVKTGLQATIADADARASRAQSILNKIAYEEVKAEAPVEAPVKTPVEDLEV